LVPAPLTPFLGHPLSNPAVSGQVDKRPTFTGTVSVGGVHIDISLE